ncbi:MAG: ATP-binding cassette domain-containing protein [Dehalococcoidales bacterium]|nr:ATP-binding cassette domain-containing protein [Dehalococcoidales bacterium]
MLKIEAKKTLPGFNLDVRLTADSGILAILGPSGSGKTMTLQSVAGLMKPDEGYVEVNGRVLFDSENKINLPVQKRKVGFVFQHYALFPHLNVWDNIAYGLKDRPKEEIKAKIKQLLKTMNIDGLEGRYPRQLSAGQQQRVAIARALAPDPDVLLLDEPFSALDPLLKERLELELLDLQKVFGGSILFVTHDLNEGYKLGSMVAVYHSGAIIQHDKKENVFAHPANRNVAKMTGMRNLIEGVIAGINGENVTVTIPSWATSLRVVSQRAGDYYLNQEIILGIRPEYIHIKEKQGENVLPAQTIHKMEGIASINYRFHINSDASEKRYMEAVISKSGVNPLPKDSDCYLYLHPELLVIMAE